MIKKLIATAAIFALSAAFAKDNKTVKILSSVEMTEEERAELEDEDDADENDPTPQEASTRLNGERDVPYTKALQALMDGYFNHELADEEARNATFNAALTDAETQYGSDAYRMNVHKARAFYYYGMILMENYDLTNLEKMDLSDTSETEDVNKKAGEDYDRAIEFAKLALKERHGSDAYSMLAHAISANCTAKTTGYVLSNGLKVRANAKKAVKEDFSNGTAHFLIHAQDIYAPAPFAKVKKGRKALERCIANPGIRFEQADLFNIYSSIGYSCQRQKKYGEAKKWYDRCQELYPQNLSVQNLVSKLK